MNLLEKLDKLKKQTGDNNSTLSKKTGIPYTTIDGWYKKGYENMKMSNLKTICAYFGVTIDSLVIEDEEEVEANVDMRFERLTVIYNNLSADGKNLLLAQAEFFLSREESEIKKQSGSAG